MSAREYVIRVDVRNRAVGPVGKIRAHREGLLHRAFSVFIVDWKGAILLQKRHPEKYHSGGLWANTCCGHPRPGERTLQGARRRLHEELGITSALKFAFWSRYSASFANGMSENEIVGVYSGSLEGEVTPHRSEIADLAWMTPDELDRALDRDPHAYAYWLHHYFRYHRQELEEALARVRMT